MSTIHHHLFAESPSLRVRDVTLSPTDDLQTHREWLAHIVLDATPVVPVSEDHDELRQFIIDVLGDHYRMLSPVAGAEVPEVMPQNIAAQRASETHWQSIFEGSAVGIVLTDRIGQLALTNRAYQEMLGYTNEELQGLRYLDLVCEEDRDASLALGRELWEGRRREYRIDTRQRRKDGTLIWTRSSVSLAPSRGTTPAFATAIVENITERKHAEDRLREYEKAVESLEEMIVVVDRDYRYLMANRAFLAYRGFEREQLVGSAVAKFLEQDLWEIAKRKLDECFEGKVVNYELRRVIPPLGERDVSISCFPIHGPLGVDRVACIMQDVTERKRAEATLHRLSGRPSSLEDDERGRLSRELHDSTGQRLAALSMNLSVVNDAEAPLNPRAQRALAESMTLADECLREIRTMSYLLHPPELDALGLHSALARYIDGFVQRSGISVDNEVSDPGWLPQDVETTVFRIVQECLTNIHRHSGSSSARIRLRRGPSELVLEVHDAGTGLRGNAPLGVGIANMQERLRQFGGSLEIRSQPVGMSVTALIPL